METIQLTIPTMKSHHCQMTVTQAVQSVGASVKSMAPTKAVIEITDGLTRQAVMEAIEKAGYKVQAN
jgi:copper chaperone CopZ